jgi:hypothetical protein
MSDHPRAQWQGCLDRATQDRIGRELRVMFGESLQQPLPDKLLRALRAIQDAEENVARADRAVAARLAPAAQTSTAPRDRRSIERTGNFKRLAETEAALPAF